MIPSEGYIKAKKGQVCKLKCSLYGLKQDSCQCNAEFTHHLHTFGFMQFQANHCLFVYNSAKGFLVLIVYVDDLLITGTSESLIQDIKKSLRDAFTIKDMGLGKYFMGSEVVKSFKGICVHQRKYVSDLIADAGLKEAKIAITPLHKGMQLSHHQGELSEDPSQYRRLIGRLLYLNLTRPDIMYSVHQLSQFVHNPRKHHWLATLHVLRYLKGTVTTGLYFPANNSFSVEAFCDADWATCRNSRRSVTGFFIFSVNFLEIQETTLSFFC